MRKHAAILFAVLALPACSTVDRWMDSSGGGGVRSSTAMHNTSIDPTVTNDASNPANLYFGD